MSHTKMGTTMYRVIWPKNKKTFIEYLAGLVYGDGQIEKYRITITDQYKEFLDEVAKRIKDLMEVEPKLHRRKGYDVWYMRIYGKDVVETIRNKISELYGNPTTNFIRGFFDAEGTIYIDNGYIIIEFDQKDPAILANIANSLYDRCIYTRIRRREYFDKRPNKNKLYVKYELRIKRKTSVYRFLNKIGLRHIKHITIISSFYSHAPSPPVGRQG